METYLMPVGLLLAGLLLLFTFDRIRRKAAASKDWTPVPGRVVEFEVLGTEKPRVTYEYSVGGHKYKRRRIWFGEVNCYGRTFWRLRESYPQSRSVTVYVNPMDPGDAVLERHYQAPLSLALGIILCMIAVVTVIVSQGFSVTATTVVIVIGTVAAILLAARQIPSL